MSLGAPSAPATPSAAETSAAQTQSNKETALYNFGLSNPNTTTPLGNINYTVDTSNPDQPRANAAITLSPAEQALFDQSTANTIQQGKTAGTALQNVSSMMNTPYDLKGNVMATPAQTDFTKNLQDTQNALYGRQTQYLDPQFQQSEEQLKSELANKGLAPGSDAYNTAMNNFALQKQKAYADARDSAVAGGTQAQATESNTALANQGQQAQLYTQQYQEPLNLYSSLMSGTSPTMPTFNGYNASTAAPTNTIAAQTLANNAALNSYNAQTGSSNSLLSGLFGLGGTLGAAAIMSDRRLKKEIKRLGTLQSGLNVYEFEYKWSKTKHIGCMADEVKKIFPAAVVRHESGFDMVNYGAIG